MNRIEEISTVNEEPITHATLDYHDRSYRMSLHQLQGYRAVLLFWVALYCCLSLLSVGVILEDWLPNNVSKIRDLGRDCLWMLDYRFLHHVYCEHQEKRVFREAIHPSICLHDRSVH